MQPRIDSPALSLPGVMPALQKLADASKRVGLPASTHEFVNLRASQINGCSVCVDMHTRALKGLGEPDERILLVSAWRESPYYSDAERAALALTEAATRLADNPEAVSDEIWDEAARHYNESELAALVAAIASINVWNRLNAATRQITGEWVAQWVEAPDTAKQAA